MIVEQISVFIENKQGRLSDIADALALNGIDISALSLAEAEEYGVLRMIVSNPHKAKEILLKQGVIGKVTKVLAVAIDDVPGGFASSLHLLTDSGIEINYMYACMSKERGKAIMILSIDDVEKGEQIILSKGKNVSPASIYRI